MRLDLGCGTRKRDGFIGVDSRKFDGVDVVCDLGVERWPFDGDTVEEAHCSHMVEHLTAPQRIHFVNELHRVMKRGAKCQIIVPHWGSTRAYGDLTHQWPPVAEMWFYYLSEAWRKDNAPHNDFYTCDFEATWGYSMHPSLAVRNVEYQQHALNFYREAAQDLIATLTKR